MLGVSVTAGGAKAVPVTSRCDLSFLCLQEALCCALGRCIAAHLRTMRHRGVVRAELRPHRRRPHRPPSTRSTTASRRPGCAGPGRTDDACAIDLTTTVVAADGTMTRETWTANPKAPIDCFYVYPTVSMDQTTEQRHDRGQRRAQRHPPAVRALRVAVPAVRAALSPGDAGGPARRRWPAASWRSSAGVRLRRRARRVEPLPEERQQRPRRRAHRALAGLVHPDAAHRARRSTASRCSRAWCRRSCSARTFRCRRARTSAARSRGFRCAAQPDQTGCLITYASFRSTLPPPANTLFGRVDRRRHGVGVHESRGARRRQRRAARVSHRRGQPDRQRRAAEASVGHERRGDRHAVCQRAGAARGEVRDQRERLVSRAHRQRRSRRSACRRHSRRSRHARQACRRTGACTSSTSTSRWAISSTSSAGSRRRSRSRMPGARCQGAKCRCGANGAWVRERSRG